MKKAIQFLHLQYTAEGASYGMTSIVLLRNDLEGKIREAAPVAGYSERNFSRYLNNRMVQELPLGCIKNLFAAGFISEDTYKAIKQERIDAILMFKRAKKKPRTIKRSPRKLIKNSIAQAQR